MLTIPLYIHRIERAAVHPRRVAAAPFFALRKVFAASGAVIFAALALFTPAASALDFDDRSEIFVIYKGETPVGYSFTTLTWRQAEKGQPDLWQVDADILISVSIGGKAMKTHQVSNETISRDFKLLKMFKHSTIGGQEYRLWAEKRGDVLAVKTRGPGGEKKSEMPYPNGAVPLSAMPFYLAENAFNGPGSFTVSALNSSHDSVYVSAMDINRRGDESCRYGDISVPVTRLETRLEGVETDYKIDAGGNIYEAVQPTLDLTQKKVEIVDLYTIGGWLPWDLSKSTLLAPDAKIKNPDKILWMDVVLDWAGAGTQPDLESANQTVITSRSKSEAVVRVARKPVSGAKIALAPSAAQLLASLAEDDKIQSGHPGIAAVAEEAAAGATSTLGQAWAISEWIHQNIAADPSTRGNSISAVVTLENSAGTDKHAAVLFAAMARARGIPTRLCFGKLFTMGLFVTHYWDEVYADGKWYAADPTSDGSQPPMLIKLASADTTEKLSEAAGKLDPRLSVKIKAKGYK